MARISDMPTCVISEKLIESDVAEVRNTALAVNRYLEDEIGSLLAESSLAAQITEKPRAGYEYKYGSKTWPATLDAGHTIRSLDQQREDAELDSPIDVLERVLRDRPQLGYIDVQLVASPSGAPQDLNG